MSGVPEVQPGKRFKTWTVVDQIGYGQTALTYRAINDHGKEVKIKCLRPELQADADARASLLEEVEKQRRTDNDIDYVDSAGRFFVSTYRPGKTLRDRLTERRKKVGFYGGPESNEVYRLVAIELAERHPDTAWGDAKPENVILDPRHGGYRVWLIDNGSAFHPAAGERPKNITPEYAAPENFTGQRITHKADIYSIGVMLFEANTGTLPFRAKTREEVAALHLDGSLDTALLTQRCPAALVTLILECLDRDPDKRPEARDVADRLHPLTVPPREPDLGASSDRHGFDLAESAHAPPRGSRWLIAAGAAALVLASMAIVSVRYPKLVRLLSHAPRPDTHPLTAAEIKQQCAPYEGTAYACVPAGEFQSGQTAEEIDALCDRLGPDCTRGSKGVSEFLKRSLPKDGHPRRVWLSTFAMMKDPVTCGEWAVFLTDLRTQKGFDPGLEERNHDPHDGSAPIKRPRYPTFEGKRFYDTLAPDACIDFDERTEVYSPKPGMERLPVQDVSWYGASKYCEEQKAALPTEAQFERVRRSAGTLYPWGSSATPACADIPYGQYVDDHVVPVQHGECETLDEALKGPRNVGSTIDVVPGFGIHDLGSNVREWARDGFIDQLLPCEGGLCINPVVAPQKDHLFVMSGGAYQLGRWFMYSTSRGRYDGVKTDRSNGFRCVKPN